MTSTYVTGTSVLTVQVVLNVGMTAAEISDSFQTFFTMFTGAAKIPVTTVKEKSGSLP